MRIFAIALCATLAGLGQSEAEAQCRKFDCSGDPGAWAGATGAKGAEQQAAAKAAAAVALAQQEAANAALLADMGIVQRQKLLFNLEDTLTRLSGKPATVVGATVLARGGGYLFCGGALYRSGDASMFVLDTRGGTTTLRADKATWVAAGCELPAIRLR